VPKGFIGQVIGPLITVLILFGVYLARETLVNDFVVPTVKKSLEDGKFLRDQIADGKFVVVDENEFAENHPIEPKYIKELKDGKYSKLRESIESMVQENIQPIKDRAQKLEDQMSRVEAIHKAESEGYIEVHLYESKQDADQDVLVLDAEDPVIGHWLTNGHYYQLRPLRGDGEEQCVKLRLDKGILDKKAHGRLYETQFHRLFTGSTSRGLGNASIELKKLEDCKE